MTNIEIYTLEKDLIDKKDNQLDEPVKVVSTRMLNKKLTSKRRKDMRVKVIEFNISNNHLAQEKKLYLKQLLTEAKYYYNYLLNLSQHSCVDDYGNIVYTNPIFSIDTKNNHIEVFNTATLEVMPYEIKNLSSQVKQKIKDKITDSIKALSKRKSKGFKVGQLKFKSEVNIPLKQFNNTYYLADDFKYLSIQGSKFNFKLNPHKAIKKLSKELGFSQLSIQGLLDNKIIEIANAEIIKGLNKSKLNCNYKLSLTIYINPEIYDDDKLLIIKHNIKKYLKTKINLFGNKATNDFDKDNQPRINENRIKEAKILKEIELKKNLNQTNIKETKQPEINQLNHIPYKNNPNHIESNQITAFNFNLTPEQRAVISLTGIGLDAGIGNEITLNCGELYQSFSLNSRFNQFLLCTLAKIKIAQKELSQFNHRTKQLNKHKLSTGNNEDNNLLKQDKVKIVNIKGINKPLVKPTIIYSRKYQQLKSRLAKLWIKYENIKTNMINHLIGFLKQFKQVNFQNEMIKSWHQDKLKGYSKKVQAGILGKVYAKLKSLNITNPDKYRMLETYHKTTQDCVMCGKANKLKLSDRVYKCSCGYENNRDTHGGFNMILKNDLIINNQSFKNKVFGRNTSNLVQIITSETSKDNTSNVFDIAGIKLESKSYMKLSFNSHISHTRSLVL